MIPVIGKHLVVFGDGSDYEQKFHRLLAILPAGICEDRVLINTVKINVSFNGQVVATKKGTISKVDSLQALKKCEKI